MIGKQGDRRITSEHLSAGYSSGDLKQDGQPFGERPPSCCYSITRLRNYQIHLPVAAQLSVVVGDIRTLVETIERRFLPLAIAFSAGRSKRIAADVDILACLGIRTAGHAILVIATLIAALSAVPVVVPV